MMQDSKSLSQGRHCPVVALIGGVGAGKSFVAGLIQSECRARIIDADRIGHELLLDPEVISPLTEAFGRQILGPNGQIDRAILAREVFGEETGAEERRHRLESIVHPRIRLRIEQLLAAGKADPDCDLIVLDAPVLLEVGWRELADSVVFVDATQGQRENQVRFSRGWSPDRLKQREASQWTLERKRSTADYILDNTRGAEFTRTQVRKLLEQLIPVKG